MADGEITLKLNDEMERRLRQAAADEGLTAEELGSQLLSDKLADFEMVDTEGWVGGDVQADLAALEEFERTRMGVPWEDVRKWALSLGTDRPLPTPKVRKV